MDDNNVFAQNSQTNTEDKTNKQFTPDEIIDLDIFNLMGIPNMPQNQKDEILKKMVETIERRVIKKVEDKLSDEDMAKIEAAINSNDQNAFMQTFTDKGISIEKIYAEETLLYKYEMMELMNNTKEQNA